MAFRIVPQLPQHTTQFVVEVTYVSLSRRTLVVTAAAARGTEIEDPTRGACVEDPARGGVGVVSVTAAVVVGGTGGGAYEVALSTAGVRAADTAGRGVGAASGAAGVRVGAAIEEAHCALWCASE